MAPSAWDTLCSRSPSDVDAPLFFFRPFSLSRPSPSRSAAPFAQHLNTGVCVHPFSVVASLHVPHHIMHSSHGAAYRPITSSSLPFSPYIPFRLLLSRRLSSAVCLPPPLSVLLWRGGDWMIVVFCGSFVCGCAAAPQHNTTEAAHMRQAEKEGATEGGGGRTAAHPQQDNTQCVYAVHKTHSGESTTQRPITQPQRGSQQNSRELEGTQTHNTNTAGPARTTAGPPHTANTPGGKSDGQRHHGQHAPSKGTNRRSTTQRSTHTCTQHIAGAPHSTQHSAENTAGRSQHRRERERKGRTCGNMLHIWEWARVPQQRHYCCAQHSHATVCGVVEVVVVRSLSPSLSLPERSGVCRAMAWFVVAQCVAS